MFSCVTWPQSYKGPRTYWRGNNKIILTNNLTLSWTWAVNNDLQEKQKCCATAGWLIRTRDRPDDWWHVPFLMTDSKMTFVILVSFVWVLMTSCFVFISLCGSPGLECIFRNSAAISSAVRFLVSGTLNHTYSPQTTQKHRNIRKQK